MNVARILYPVLVLGPGKRVGIWVAGCSRGCKGCSNPELWERKTEYEVTVEMIDSLVRSLARERQIDGFTITGGEPMDQADELAVLTGLLSEISTDILVYTGYRIGELRDKRDQAIDSVLDRIAVLIDGEYIEDMNDGVFLKGSSNQQVHILDQRHEGKYRCYLAEGHNRIQNFTTTDGVVSVGIHRRSF